MLREGERKEGGRALESDKRSLRSRQDRMRD
jgi:hypothetical protein